MSELSEEKACELAKQHWRYVLRVLINSETNINPKFFDIIGFHYLTAFEHGYKHGYDECKREVLSR